MSQYETSNKSIQATGSIWRYSVCVGTSDPLIRCYTNSVLEAEFTAICGAKAEGYASIMHNDSRGLPCDIQRYYRNERGEVTTLVYDPKAKAVVLL